MDGPTAINEARKYGIRLKKELKPDDEMQWKHCPKCDTDKPIDEFYNNRKNPDGKGYYCKECDKKRINANDAKKRDKSRKIKAEKKEKEELNPMKEKMNKPTAAVKIDPIRNLKSIIIHDMALANNDNQPIMIHLHVLSEIEKKQAEQG